MDKIKLRAIVIKEIPIGEGDKLIVLLAKGTGKITVKARGSKNVKNHTALGTSLFSYCDYIVLKTKTGFILTQADIIESFYEVAADLDKFAYAAVVLETAEKICRENQPDDEIMFLVLKTIQKIAKSAVNPRIALMVYYIKLMEIFGCMPECECICGNSAEFADGVGFYCKKCRTPQSVKVSETAVSVIDYVLRSDIKNIFSIKTDCYTLNEIEKIERKIFDHNIDIEIRSLAFADSIKNM